MAAPIWLAPAFNGMARDYPRNSLPKGKAWNLVDYIPGSLGAQLTQRGGWGYASPSLTAADASATYVRAALEAPFTAGRELLVIDDNSHLIKVVSSLSATNIGSATTPLQNPVIHQQTVIIPSSDGATQMFQYAASSVAGMGTSSVPTARYAAVWVNRTWAASTTAQPQRVYASDAGDPTSYAMTGTSASYIDVGFPVMGLAALPNVLMVFGRYRTARFRGSTPPPNSDMIVDDPIFNYGCADARSIAVNGAWCCFADVTGVYLTNGTSTPEDLTLLCGIKRYWRNLLSTYDSSTWTIAGGWYGNFYVVSVMDGTTFKDAFIFDISTHQVIRASNLKSLCFAQSTDAGAELYMGLRSAARLASLSSMWSPSATYKNDGDGTAVTGIWESPFYDATKPGSQRWRDVYLEYDLGDDGDTPTITLSYVTDPAPSSTYTAISPTFAATTERTYMRRHIFKANVGMGFKVTRTNASSAARIYALGTTVYSHEGSRLKTV